MAAPARTQVDVTELDRLYKLRSILSDRTAHSTQDLMAILEISRAQLRRDIAKLRDQLHAPVRFDPDRKGYVLDRSDERLELPGLWLNAEELLALATVQHLLEQLAPGVLGVKLGPLKSCLHDLLGAHNIAADNLRRRVRLTHAAGKRRLLPATFEAVASATLTGKRLQVSHFNRMTGESTSREISPQRLVHYRDNWYVDAWCHERKALRSFSVDALVAAEKRSGAAQGVGEDELDAHLSASYGIFAGAPMAEATLRFTADRSRWIRREVWHPGQVLKDLPDGGVELKVPYSDERELVGDILRHGPAVEVISPNALRDLVANLTLDAANIYARTKQAEK